MDIRSPGSRFAVMLASLYAIAGAICLFVSMKLAPGASSRAALLIAVFIVASAILLYWFVSRHVSRLQQRAERFRALVETRAQIAWSADAGGRMLELS